MASKRNLEARVAALETCVRELQEANNSHAEEIEALASTDEFIRQLPEMIERSPSPEVATLLFKAYAVSLGLGDYLVSPPQGGAETFADK